MEGESCIDVSFLGRVGRANCRRRGHPCRARAQRNRAMDIYRSLLRPVLFSTGAETAHRFTIATAELVSSSHWLCSQFERSLARRSIRLAIEVKGVHFRTPLGLAAGFDKSARAVPLLAALGFGHVEVGS